MDRTAVTPMTPSTTVPHPRNTSRRSLLRAAAWAPPAVLVASSAPAFAASETDLGAFDLTGTCGVLGLLGPGFTLTASPDEALPVGTQISITGAGIANIGVFSVTGGTASVNVLGATSRLITLGAALPAGATLEMRTTLSISVAFTLSAVATLPTGYTATGAKTSGTVSSTLIFCSAT